MEQDAAPAGLASSAGHSGGFGAPPGWVLWPAREELADTGRKCPARSAARGRVAASREVAAKPRWSAERRSVPHRDATRRQVCASKLVARTEGWCAARRSTSPLSRGPAASPDAFVAGAINVAMIGTNLPRRRCTPSPAGEGLPNSRQTLTPHPTPLPMGEGADRASLEKSPLPPSRERAQHVRARLRGPRYSAGTAACAMGLGAGAEADAISGARLSAYRKAATIA